MTSGEPNPGYDPAVLDNYANVFLNLRDRGGEDSRKLTAGTRIAITSVVRKPGYESSLDVAGRLAAGIIEGWPDFNSVDDVLAHSIGSGIHLASLVDHVKVKALGPGGSNLGSNTLIAHACSRLASAAAHELHRFPTQEAVQKTVDYYAMAQTLVGQDRPGVSWMAFKAQRMAGQIFANYNLLGELYDRRAANPADAEAVQLRSANDELWHELRATQTYGVKPAIAPAFKHGYITEWLFTGTNAAKDVSERTARVQNGAAITSIVGSENPFKSSLVGVEHYIYEQSHVRIRYTDLTGVIDASDRQPIYTSMLLDRSGHLLDNEGSPLEVLSREYDFNTEYEQLRSEILALYFDLVTPVYVQEVLGRQVSTGSADTESTERTGKLRRLVLARTKTLRITKDEIADAMREEEEDEEQTTNRRMIVKHPVIGHIRNLPPTFRASAEARALCLEDLEIELAEFGETYVRKHERGTIPETDPKGHKAAYKVGKAAVQGTRPQVNPTGRRNKNKKRR